MPAVNDRGVRQAALLDEELEYYEKHFDEYREKYPGRHLLIAGRKLHGQLRDPRGSRGGWLREWLRGDADQGKRHAPAHIVPVADSQCLSLPTAGVKYL